MDVFLELNHYSWGSDIENQSLNVCIGKEWYRFPSSFFLPAEYESYILKHFFITVIQLIAYVFVDGDYYICNPNFEGSYRAHSTHFPMELGQFLCT